MLSLKGQVAGYGFDDILSIIKTALDGNIENVLILQGIHLSFLEFAHAAGWRKHEDLNAFTAFHSVFGCAAGISARGAENIQAGFFAGEHKLKERTQVLHRHVFKGERRTVGKLENAEVIFQPNDGRDFFEIRAFAAVSVNFGRVSGFAQTGDIRALHIFGKKTCHGSRELSVREAAPVL